MKLASSISAVCAALLLSASVVAQNANNCNTEDKERNGADFVLTEQTPFNLTWMHNYFKSRGKLASVADVFDDGNQTMTTDGLGNRIWEHYDETTHDWVPQGFTTTADAADVGTLQSKDGFIVSWHNDDDTSVRVTFVNKANNNYRHVLLVEPEGNETFKNIAIHAGGITAYGYTLWVVDSANQGLRVFDLQNIWEVENGPLVGKMTGGGYSAAGYKYVLPQLRFYKFTSDFNFRFSYMSLDRSSTPDSILVGEYQEFSDDAPVRMVKWEINSTDRRLRNLDSSGRAQGIWAYCVNIDRIQGAVQNGDKVYITRDNYNDPGDFFGWIPGELAFQNRYMTAEKPEDLSYDKRGPWIFTATEMPGRRWIQTFNPANIKFS